MLHLPLTMTNPSGYSPPAVTRAEKFSLLVILRAPCRSAQLLHLFYFTRDSQHTWGLILESVSLVSQNTSRPASRLPFEVTEGEGARAPLHSVHRRHETIQLFDSAPCKPVVTREVYVAFTHSSAPSGRIRRRKKKLNRAAHKRYTFRTLILELSKF